MCVCLCLQWCRLVYCSDDTSSGGWLPLASGVSLLLRKAAVPPLAWQRYCMVVSLLSRTHFNFIYFSFLYEHLFVFFLVALP